MVGRSVRHCLLACRRLQVQRRLATRPSRWLLRGRLWPLAGRWSGARRFLRRHRRSCSLLRVRAWTVGRSGRPALPSGVPASLSVAARGGALSRWIPKVYSWSTLAVLRSGRRRADGVTRSAPASSAASASSRPRLHVRQWASSKLRSVLRRHRRRVRLASLSACQRLGEWPPVAGPSRWILKVYPWHLEERTLAG